MEREKLLFIDGDKEFEIYPPSPPLDRCSICKSNNHWELVDYDWVIGKEKTKSFTFRCHNSYGIGINYYDCQGEVTVFID